MIAETLAGTIVGYLISSIRKTKGTQTAFDEMSKATWEWVRPIFLKEDKEKLLVALKEDPSNEEIGLLIKSEIQHFLSANPSEKEKVEKMVSYITGKDSTNRTVNNYGDVTKQINNPTINGDLNM